MYNRLSINANINLLSNESDKRELIRSHQYIARREGYNMALNRNITSLANWILDNFCPPILRDCYPLMYPIYRMACGRSTEKILKYRDNYPFLSGEEYAEYYSHVFDTQLSRPTDLNRASLRFILKAVVPNGNCLDVGAGRGFLAKQLSATGCKVTALDIDHPLDYSSSDGYTFVQGTVEELPFSDESFDTVTCCHVLEHVRNVDKAMQELIRVTKNKLLIILPKQREYRYTPDLHVRFFTYEHNIRAIIPSTYTDQAAIVRCGMDWGIIIQKSGSIAAGA